MNSLRFSIVIPCYNEGASLLKLIDQAEYIAQQGQGEFIFVNNGSVDDSAAIFQEASKRGFKVVNLETNQGYGGGILAGLELASSDIIGWTHADHQTPLGDVLLATEMFTADKVFVKGFRRGRPASSRFFSAGMGVFETILFRTPLREINAQPTLFHKSLQISWDPPSDFSLDLYAYVLAKRKGYSIKRFDVSLKDRLHGVSSWNTSFASKSNFIKRTFRYSLKLKRELRNAAYPS